MAKLVHHLVISPGASLLLKLPLVFCLIAALLTVTGCSLNSLWDANCTRHWLGLIDARKFQQVTQELNARLESNPRDCDAQYCYVVAQEAQQHHAQALGRINQYLDAWPGSARGYSQRAEILINMGKFSEALADANLAIGYDPAVGANFMRRAKVYAGLHKFAEALADADTANQDKATTTAYELAYLRARCYWGLERFQEALQQIDTAAALGATDDPQLFIIKAKCQAGIGNWAAGLAACDAYQKRQPHDIVGGTLHAALLSASGKREEARQEFTKLSADWAKSGSPSTAAIANVLDLGADVPSVADAALTCLANGKQELAIALLAEVAGRRLFDPQEVFAEARAAVWQGNIDRAERLLDECLASDPTWKEPRRDLIELYRRRGLPQKAAELQREGSSLSLSFASR